MESTVNGTSGTVARRMSGSIENSGERHGTTRDTGLEQRHGTHADASEPAGAGATRDVVCRHGGSGENELPRLPTGIDGPAHVIPDRGHDLPFVDQSRRDTVEHERGLDFGGPAGLLVDVEPYRACRHGLGGRRLAARLGALDHHRPGGFEPRSKLPLDDTRLVCIRGHATSSAVFLQRLQQVFCK